MSQSLKSGNWSDPSVWDIQPSASQLVTISHNITLDVPSVNVAGMKISAGASLTHNNISTTITSTKNIVVEGTWTIKAPLPTVTHKVVIAGINEDNFVGNTDTVVDSDIGIWVMGAGQLLWQGQDKTAWTYAAEAILQGSLALTLTYLKGWNVGDQIVVTPTAKGANNYDERTITGINGTTITLNSPLGSHPIVDNTWTAEVANLTRNINIEGTANGRTHLFIKSSKPQVITNVGFRYMGPRKNVAGGPEKEFVRGRYAVHFHHSGDGSRGSMVLGCCSVDAGSHCYVPHGSHGIMMCYNVAYKVFETPYWYDLGHVTNDLMWKSNLAADVRFVSRAIQQEDGTPAFATAGFVLGMGDGNSCTDNVVVGCTGLERTDYGGAFNWEANNEGVWHFNNNLAHHCTDGVRTWQNTSKVHIVENFNSYYCQNGIFHGAYVNVYKYVGGKHFASPIVVHAGSDNSARARFEKLVCKGDGSTRAGIIIEGSPVPGALPVLVKDCSFENFTEAGVLDVGGEELHHVDVLNSGTSVKVTGPGEIARVQPTTGQSLQITSSGTSNIPEFAPRIWGDGDGLLATYFSEPNFTNPVVTRVDPNIVFQEWSSGVHYKITDPNMSVRWTGKIMPQFSETYTFSFSADGANGKASLWIDNKQINSGGAIALEAGKLYPIRFEFVNQGSTQSGVNLYWRSPSLDKFSRGPEYIPQSQLFSDEVPGSTTTTSTSTLRPSTTTTTSTTRSTTTTSTTTRPVTTTTTTSTTRTTSTTSTTSTTRSTTTTSTTTRPVTTTSTTTTSTSTKPGPKVIIELYDDGTWKQK